MCYARSIEHRVVIVCLLYRVHVLHCPNAAAKYAVLCQLSCGWRELNNHQHVSRRTSHEVKTLTVGSSSLTVGEQLREAVHYFFVPRTLADLVYNVIKFHVLDHCGHLTRVTHVASGRSLPTHASRIVSNEVGVEVLLFTVFVGLPAFNVQPIVHNTD